MTYVIILFRTIIAYMIIKLISKYVNIKKLSISNIITILIITTLISMSIKEYNQPLLHFIVPIILIIILNLDTKYLKKKFKNVIIIHKGKLNFKEMIKSSYNLTSLLIELKKNNIKEIEEVEYAILKPSGSLLIKKGSLKTTKYSTLTEL